MRFRPARRLPRRWRTTSFPLGPARDAGHRLHHGGAAGSRALPCGPRAVPTIRRSRRGAEAGALRAWTGARSRAQRRSGTGSASAYRAVFERRNVIVTQTPDELADTLELFQLPAPPAGAGDRHCHGFRRRTGADRRSRLRCRSASRGSDAAAPKRALTEVLDPGMTRDQSRRFLWRRPHASAGSAFRLSPTMRKVGIVALATNLVHGRPYLTAATAAIETVFNATEKPALVFGNLHSTISREEAAGFGALGIPVLMGTTTALLAMRHLGLAQLARGAVRSRRSRTASCEHLASCSHEQSQGLRVALPAAIRRRGFASSRLSGSPPAELVRRG